MVGCSPWGGEESDTTQRLHFHFSLSCNGEGNGNPLQYLAWRIPGTAEPSGLLCMGLHRVRHDCLDLAAAAAVALPCNPTRIEIFEIGDLVFFFYCIHHLSEIVPEVNSIYTKSISLVIHSLKINF